MADEEEVREAKAKHRRAMDLLRDLRGDTDYRITETINRYGGREMDDFAEERDVRAGIREDLTALQRRIDQTLNSLR